MSQSRSGNPTVENNSQGDMFENETKDKNNAVEEVKKKPGPIDGKKVKVIPILTNDQYEEIFRAVLERYPPEEDSPNNNDDFNCLVDESDSAEGVPPQGQEQEQEQGRGNQVPISPIMSEGTSAVLAQVLNEETPPADDANTLASFKAPTKESKKALKKKKARGEHKKAPKKGLHDVYKFTDNDHNKCSKKMVPKKRKSPTENKRTEMMKREIEKVGTWVQCSLTSCRKWRYLEEVYDPTLLPEIWTCPMNKDTTRNSCCVPEQNWDPVEEENFIFTKFAEASLVWARLPGYPFWPAMVEIDPDYDVYYECRTAANVVTHIHVVFFDDNVSRAWVSCSNVKPFTGDEKTTDFKCTFGGVSYKKQLECARKRANEALDLSLNERLHKHGFATRFKGRWNIAKKDTALRSSQEKIVRREDMKAPPAARSSHGGAFSMRPDSQQKDNEVENFSDADSVEKEFNELLVDCQAIINDVDEEFFLSQENRKEKAKKKKEKKDRFGKESRKKKKESGDNGLKRKRDTSHDNGSNTRNDEPLGSESKKSKKSKNKENRDSATKSSSTSSKPPKKPMFSAPKVAPASMPTTMTQNSPSEKEELDKQDKESQEDKLPENGIKVKEESQDNAIKSSSTSSKPPKKKSFSAPKVAPKSALTDITQSIPKEKVKKQTDEPQEKGLRLIGEVEAIHLDVPIKQEIQGDEDDDLFLDIGVDVEKLDELDSLKGSQIKIGKHLDSASQDSADMEFQEE